MGIIAIGLMSCSKHHPIHSHGCQTYGIYHGYTEDEYIEIQEDMEEIRFMIEELEAKTNVPRG